MNESLQRYERWRAQADLDPAVAAELAAKAASVTHDGNGIYGGVFVAVCISYAFVEQDISRIIEKALTYLPAKCEYDRVVNAVMDYYRKDEQKDWRKCYGYIRDHFGYDRYPSSERKILFFSS